MSRRSAREAAVKIIFQNEFIDQRLMTESDAKGETLDAESMLAMYLNSISEEEGKSMIHQRGLTSLETDSSCSAVPMTGNRRARPAVPSWMSCLARMSTIP